MLGRIIAHERVARARYIVRRVSGVVPQPVRRSGARERLARG